MVNNVSKFPPLPANDPNVIVDTPLISGTNLPAGVTALGDGTFSANGYKPNTTGVIRITGIPNQTLITNGGYISFNVNAKSISKRDIDFPGEFTQSEGVTRAAVATILVIQGDGGGGQRISIQINNTNNSISINEVGGAGNLVSTGVTSVGKDEKLHFVFAMYGNRIKIYINGVDVVRDIDPLVVDYDVNQANTIYVGANDFAGGINFGPYDISDLQIGRLPPSVVTNHKRITIWGDSFILLAYGALGAEIGYLSRNLDASGISFLKREFNKSGRAVKIIPWGESGRGWASSYNPSQDSIRASIAETGCDILIMANSVNGVHSTDPLASDYQSSLEAHIDYVITNNANLETIIFVSMMPFTQNPGNIADRTSGVVEASNLVFENLVAYVEANYPQVKAVFYDMFTKTGGHNYPADWNYGVISGVDNIHPSPKGFYNIAPHFYSMIDSVL